MSPKRVQILKRKKDDEDEPNLISSEKIRAEAGCVILQRGGYRADKLAKAKSGEIAGYDRVLCW